MNKFLLLGLGCGISATALAQASAEPKILDEFYTMGISPKGNVILSATDEVISLYNVESGERTDFFGWMISAGNYMTEDGRIIVSSTYDDQPVFVKDGVQSIPENLAAKYPFCDLAAITADGKRICGLVLNPETGTETNYVPVYFDVEEDGTISDAHYLPYPKKDFMNLDPQYVTTRWISRDGKTILGQVIDYSGSAIYPILFKEGADGEWNYTLPTSEFINPEHREIPEYPADLTMTPPQFQNYMTPEEYAAYEAAFEAWVASGYTTEYPVETNFMTAEEIAAYNEAVDAYNAVATEYNNAIMAFFEQKNLIQEESVFFMQNAFAMNAEGTLAAMSAIEMVETDDPNAWDPFVEIHPTYIFNLETGEYTRVEDINGKYPVPGQILSDGTVVASTPVPSFFSSDQTPPQSFVINAGTSFYMPLEDYLAVNNPSSAEWMVENLTWPVEIGFDDNWNPVTENVLMSGHAVFSDDKNVISGGIMAYYNPELTTTYMSYVFTDVTTGVEAIAGAKGSLKALKGGVLAINGEVENVAVYDLAGNMLYAAPKATGNVETGIASGIYIVRYTNPAGEVLSVKVRF